MAVCCKADKSQWLRFLTWVALCKLKDYTMKTTIKYEVKEITWTEKTFVARRAKVSFDKLTEFFTASYGSISRALQQMAVDTVEAPFAIYYLVDETNKETDLAAAVAVNQPLKEIKGFQLVTIPTSKALSVEYYGPYDYMGQAYEALEEYMKDHNYKSKLTLEQYFTDPLIEKDPEKWKTVIYFIVNE